MILQVDSAYHSYNYEVPGQAQKQINSSIETKLYYYWLGLRAFRECPIGEGLF